MVGSGLGVGGSWSRSRLLQLCVQQLLGLGRLAMGERLLLVVSLWLLLRILVSQADRCGRILRKVRSASNLLTSQSDIRAQSMRQLRCEGF